MSHKKFGPDRFSRFDVYWIQTDRQTNKHPDRQAKFIYRLMKGSVLENDCWTPPPPPSINFVHDAAVAPTCTKLIGWGFVFKNRALGK